jgi:hypothetical protein
MIAIDEEYRRALNVIRDNAYQYRSDEEIFEMFIEEYLLRERGRLGKIRNGIYIERESK